MGAEIGKLLSHYRILAKLGEGGMGIVYRAEDERLHRLVALKVLRPDALSDEEHRRRFLREASFAAAVAHPYIAAIHETDEVDGRTFIVMEFVEGETLRSLLGKGALPLRDALRVGAEIAEGLARAHEAQVVHRDLKPENVMVRPDRHVKILDFGLAKLVERRDGATESTVSRQETRTADLTGRGDVLGTLAYMSPEQARGQPVDHRSDVFSLGTTLYEMVTRKHPFRGLSDADTLSSIIRDAPAPASQLNADVTQELERILDKCLEKDPGDRYQHTEDLVVDLKHLERGTESHPRGTLLPARTRADVASVAVLPFADLSAEKDQEYFADGVAEELLSSLARIPGLRVTGRTSSFSFKGKNEDLRAIGRKLNVGAILEGSVRKAGKRMRITAQLVNSADGFHLWSETYDRTLDDIFVVQEDIARAVTGALKVTLVGKERMELKARSGSTEAYNAYLQAEYFQKRRSKEDLERAVGYYHEALGLDPHYALAWARLAAAQGWRAAFDYIPMDEGFGKAREAVERALVLDPDLALAYTALVWIKLTYEWDWAGMDAASQRALALEPDNADVLLEAAKPVIILGRFEEAVTLFRRAVEIDPLNANAWDWLGYAYSWTGRQEEATASFKKAAELNPEFPLTRNHLGIAYLLQGRPEAALEEMERERNPVFRLQGLALAFHAQGLERESQAALGELIEGFQSVAALQIAEVYAFRAEADSAFEWLERAYAQRDGGLGWTKSDPILKSLERDARYAAFLMKMGLPP